MIIFLNRSEVKTMAMNESSILYDELVKVHGDDPVKIEEKIAQSKNFMQAVRDLIEVCGDDPNRNGLEETPLRVIRAFLEYTEGYRDDPKKHLEKVFDVDHEDIIMVKDIEIFSMCEHHFAPFFGVAHIGYIPNGKITGLSKIARMAEGYAKRFQVQERLTNQIANAMDEVLQAQGVMVVIEAKHMCMCGRGVRKSDAVTKTIATRGVMKNEEKRMEFLSLLRD
jgi:GTP cyclohydrolase I